MGFEEKIIIRIEAYFMVQVCCLLIESLEHFISLFSILSIILFLFCRIAAASHRMQFLYILTIMHYVSKSWWYCFCSHADRDWYMVTNGDGFNLGIRDVCRGLSNGLRSSSVGIFCRSGVMRCQTIAYVALVK